MEKQQALRIFLNLNSCRTSLTLGCEGERREEEAKPTARQAMGNGVDRGGRKSQHQRVVLAGPGGMPKMLLE